MSCEKRRKDKSFQFVPTAVKSLMPPTPFVTPVRWAPKITFSKRRVPANSVSSPPNGSQRRRAETPALRESGGQDPALHESVVQDYQGSSEVPACPSSFSTGGDNGHAHLSAAV